MKKSFIITLILFIAILLSVGSVTGCNSDASISLNINYTSTDGGYISGKTSQRVSVGEDAEEIVAVPEENYFFVGWSDGVTNHTRKDTNIKFDLNVTAKFEKTKHEVNYTAGEGGYISGYANQIIEADETTDLIVAKPNLGYIFVKWSDNSTDPARSDIAKANKTYSAEFLKIFDGKGTHQEPYQVADYQGLINMKYYPYDSYILIGDIDLNNISYEPIFHETNRFEGIFDGNGHSIKNLYVDSDSNLKYPSLFGFIGSFARVENLNISNFLINFKDMESSAIFAGALAGVSHGELTNISVSGEMNSTEALRNNSLVAGGLVGWSTGKATNCSSDIVFNATDIFQTKNRFFMNLGGLIGFVENDVIACNAKGRISLLSNGQLIDRNRISVGGVIGIYQYTGSGSSSVKFTDSYADVSIGSNINVISGGFLGNISDENSIIDIENCFSNGDIYLKSQTDYVGYAGGFAGSIFIGAGSSIKNCYSTGKVSADSANGFALNLLGYNLMLAVINCHSIGDVSGRTDANGFASSVSANLYQCYSNSNAYSVSHALGFINSFSGIMKRCYSTGDIQSQSDSTGFIWYAYGIIEECYRTGSISAGGFGCGFIFVGDFSLYNCYSTSDIVMSGEDIVGAYGFVGITGCSVINCYYGGTIAFEQEIDYEYMYLALFGSDIEGDIINCHVVSSDNLINPIEKSRDSSLVTELTSYGNVSKMFQLADILNGQDYDVWINVSDTNGALNGTPILKDLLKLK